MRFREQPSSIRGSITAMVTPFTADGGIDEPGLRRLIDWQIAQGSDGISICGSTGEPSAMSVSERIRVIRIVTDHVADRVPVLAGTGTGRLDETIEITTAAARAGVDGVLVVTPYYSRPTQEALRQWYLIVAASVPEVPVIAYNVPGRTAVDLAPTTVAAMFHEVDNFVGIKQTTFDFEHFSRVIHLCGPDLLVYSGIEMLSLPLLALGGAGYISATANIAPAASARMFRLWESGDIDGARRLHFDLHPLNDLLFVETSPAPTKWVLCQRGLIDSDYVRPPLTPPSPEAIDRITDLLEQGRDLLSPTPGQIDRLTG